VRSQRSSPHHQEITPKPSRQCASSKRSFRMVGALPQSDRITGAHVSHPRASLGRRVNRHAPDPCLAGPARRALRSVSLDLDGATGPLGPEATRTRRSASRELGGVLGQPASALCGLNGSGARPRQPCLPVGGGAQLGAGSAPAAGPRCPTPTSRGSRSASLRTLWRAWAVSKLYAGSGTCAGRGRPHMSVTYRASLTSASGRARGTGRSGRARGRAARRRETPRPRRRRGPGVRQHLGDRVAQRRFPTGFAGRGRSACSAYAAVPGSIARNRGGSGTSSAVRISRWRGVISVRCCTRPAEPSKQPRCRRSSSRRRLGQVSRARVSANG
jgi:hypothetical protein